MKNNSSILFFLISFIFLASCSDSVDEGFPKKYTQQAYVGGEIKMFTQNGEVTDKSVIEKFTKGIQESYLDIDQEVYDNFDVDIIFNSENNGVVVIPSDDIEEEKSLEFSLKEMDDYYNICMNDTIVSAFSSSYKEEYSRYKCFPEYIDTTYYLMGRGIDIIYTHLRPLYVKKSRDEIRVCFVSFKEVKYINGEFSRMRSRGPINNLINEEYLLSIQNLYEGWPVEYTDTIAYKESYIVFR